MPRTEHYDLREEWQRIEAELEELAAEVAAEIDGIDDDSSAVPEETRSRISDLQDDYVALAWALNEDDDAADRDRDAPYESVTITGLTSGGYVKAGQMAKADGQEMDIPVEGDVQELYRVATAIDEADFIPDGASFTQKLTAVSDLNPIFYLWLKAQVDTLTRPTVEGNGFIERVEANLSADESTSTSDE